MKAFKRRQNSYNRYVIHEKGVSKFTDETDMVEIIKSVRMLKILTKILLSNEQIKLLAFENSSLLHENYGDKFDENSEIINDQNGINVRSAQVVPSELENHKHQDVHEQHPNESQTDIGHKDLLSYLSKQQNPDFIEGINKLVDEFGNQEDTEHKIKILKHGFGIADDSSDESWIDTDSSLGDQSDGIQNNSRSVGEIHVDLSNGSNSISDRPRQDLTLPPINNQG